MPMACAPTAGREASKVAIAAFFPAAPVPRAEAAPAARSRARARRSSSFSLPPSRQCPGILTSSRTTSAVCEARMPCFLNFWPWESPEVPGGTMNEAWPRAPRAGSTVATMTCTSAMPPLVAQVLVPVSTHSSVASWYTARVRSAETSEPASGSEEQKAASLTSSGVPNICGAQVPICSSVPLASTATAARVVPTMARPRPASPQNSSSIAIGMPTPDGSKYCWA